MKSTVTFKIFFRKFLKEDVTSAAFIASDNVADIYDPNNPVSQDNYAPKNAVIPKGNKIIQTRKGKIKIKKNKKNGSRSLDK